MTAGGAAGVIGREDELRTIASVIDGAGADPRALLLEGEAGIGKTTLWEWGVERARGRGHLVLRCRPAKAEANLPFAALGASSTSTCGELPRPRRSSPSMPRA